MLQQFVVLPFDTVMADRWAQITAHRRSLEKPIDCGDAWIAASAIRHDATLLTHNRTHYENIPALKLISYGREFQAGWFAPFSDNPKSHSAASL